MTLRLTVQERDGSTQIMVRLPGVTDPEPFGPPRPFTSPLSIADLDDLRFYLEDYASLPVGEYAVRGERVEREALPAWGGALFASIFSGDVKRQEAYLLARTAKEPVEVAIRSNNPLFLALPWELMKAPGEREPLSLRVSTFDRSLLITDPARQFARTADGFRVLMVIARPAGIDDVPFQAVARPLFQHLAHSKSAVEIEILRPPSFEEFQKRLKAAKEAGKPYHAVHFDGHGTFGQANPTADGLNAHLYRGTSQGYVLFEANAGGAEPVSATDFAAAMKAGDVPLVILNACQSGKIETAEEAAGPEASVATRLLQEGAASVVAMSHSVYVVAGAAFMAVFYEELFAGKSVAEAVNEGRKALRLERNRLRPSLKGEMPLQDWMVPVHYARSSLRLAVGEAGRPTASSAEETVSAILTGAKISEGTTDGDLAPNDGVFFGRDVEFFILERAVRAHGLAVIHGVGGMGKTELAKAFARWLQVSVGLSDARLVFFHSFEPGEATFGLEGIVTKIIDRFGDAKAYLLDQKERAALVLKVLRQVRGLLIWDNFETVASMPEPGQATPPLDEAKKAELLWFIGELRKSQSALLITSRSPEEWLGGPEVFVRCEVGGLSHQDALQYSDYLLAPHAQASARRAAEPGAFKELIGYLGGHPLSLKLILPRLSEMPPSALLAGLKGQGALPPGFGVGEGRLASLGASLYYSFRHLPEQDQRRIVILSLFEKVASAPVLGTMRDAPAPFQGLVPQGWDALLSRLSELGLLTGLGCGLYRLHPALPAYLNALWRSRAKDYALEREAALLSLIAAAAPFAAFLARETGAGDAQAQITSLRASFGAFLAAALERGLFVQAQALIEALNGYWVTAGLGLEAQAWGDRALKATEPRPGQAPEIETDAHSLWLFVKGAEAIRARGVGDLAKAEGIYRQIAAAFAGRESKKARRVLSDCYHQLGWVAQDRGELEAAEGWYKKALAIYEALSDQPGMAESYHQFGNVAYQRGRLDETECWYLKSLAIFEALSNQAGMAGSYHQLGMVAQNRERLGEAEGWYKKALAIFEAHSHQPHMAKSYHQLGNVAYRRGRLDEAEGWYKKSLAIKEALGDQPGVPTTYHQLGMVARDRGRLEEAEGWCRKALAIEEPLRNQLGMAASYNQLGVLTLLRGRLEEAEGWCRKSLAIKEALSDQPGMAVSYHRLGNVALLRGRLDEAEGWTRKALAIFEALDNELDKAEALAQLARIKAQGEGSPPPI